MPDLPKFLIADDGGDRVFVVHLHYPKFVMEFVEGRGTPQFLDSESDFIELEQQAGRDPAATLASLCREAGDFFMTHADL